VDKGEHGSMPIPATDNIIRKITLKMPSAIEFVKHLKTARPDPHQRKLRSIQLQFIYCFC